MPDRSNAQDLLNGATALKPETGCAPNVHCRNTPDRFIAGTVYDPVEKEVVIGARCVLTSGEKRMKVFTDE